MDKIVVLDFGSQYNQLIARRVRELGVYSEIVPFNIDVEKLKDKNVKGIILSGGPNSVYDEFAPLIEKDLFDLQIPILGICYGMQITQYLYDGKISPSLKREYGKSTLTIEQDSPLTKNIPKESTVWMSHGDHVDELSVEFAQLGTTPSCIAIAKHKKKDIYNLQFHPEVTHTLQGPAILDRFVRTICACRGDWVMGDYISEAVARIQEQVGSDEVILGLSGGVDSSVAAALIHRAIGKQLTCVFVDHGLLRLNEGAMVMEMFARNLGVKVIRADAQHDFMSKLAGVSDPEAKRKIIGKEFVEVFGGGRSAQLNDFKEVVLYSGDSKVQVEKLGAQDKGQKAMLTAWIEGLKSGQPCVDYPCLMTTSMATIMAVESLATGMPMDVDMSLLSSVSAESNTVEAATN